MDEETRKFFNKVDKKIDQVDNKVDRLVQGEFPGQEGIFERINDLERRQQRDDKLHEQKEKAIKTTKWGLPTLGAIGSAIAMWWDKLIKLLH